MNYKNILLVMVALASIPTFMISMKQPPPAARQPRKIKACKRAICDICGFNDDYAKNILPFPCKHHFHRVCIKAFINTYQSNCCPVCKVSQGAIPIQQQPRATQQPRKVKKFVCALCEQEDSPARLSLKPFVCKHRFHHACADTYIEKTGCDSSGTSCWNICPLCKSSHREAYKAQKQLRGFDRFNAQFYGD